MQNTLCMGVDNGCPLKMKIGGGSIRVKRRRESFCVNWQSYFQMSRGRSKLLKSNIYTPIFIQRINAGLKYSGGQMGGNMGGPPPNSNMGQGMWEPVARIRVWPKLDPGLCTSSEGRFLKFY